MKNNYILIYLLAFWAVSCVNEPQDDNQTVFDETVFCATIEQAGEPSTKVFADDSLRVLWNADDRVSIFNKTTFNREYRFEGQDGANSGTFERVPSDKFVASNPLNYVYSVYPYNENTSISNDGEITAFLPAEQTYREDSFGLGANTMIAITEDDELMFKNLCGYFAVRLYGDSVSVSSISLRGNNNELLAGKATVVAQVDSIPGLTFDASFATKEITVNCPTPIMLGETEETATTIWFVIPPTLFKYGFSLFVEDASGNCFYKATTGALEIKRNVLKKTSALKVEPQPKNVIYYKSSDGEIVSPTPYAFPGAQIVSNEYVNGRGIITFDEDITSIGYRAFWGCSILTSIHIPEGVTSIGDAAFGGCSSLAGIHIPEGVTSIGTSSFVNCSRLTSFYIPESVTTIGALAFTNCSSLIRIHLPDNVTSIGFGAFRGCSSLVFFSGKYATEDGLYLINEGTLNSVAQGVLGNTAIVPEGVTKIGNYAFEGCSSLTGIHIPEGATSIGDEAFYGCSNLIDIHIPEGVTSIGNDAFYGCSNLIDIIIPDSVTKIGNHAFRGCSSLTDMYIPESVTYLGTDIFSECFALMSIGGKYATEDGMYLIYDGYLCGAALGALGNAIVLPAGIKSTSEAFRGCSSLTSIAIPESVTDISGYSFDGCSSLTSITIPEGVTSIGYRAFTDCSSLTSLTIPESVRYIKTAAFKGCSSLTDINIPDGVSEINPNLFEGCSSLVGIIIPENVRSIGQAAFRDCSSLTGIHIPEGVYSIGNNAFYGCSSLTSVTLPKNVSTIHSYAFYGCSSLTSVRVLSYNPPRLDDDIFDEFNNVNIYVPEGRVETYKQAPIWQNYASRIQPSIE